MNEIIDELKVDISSYMLTCQKHEERIKELEVELENVLLENRTLRKDIEYKKMRINQLDTQLTNANRKLEKMYQSY